MKLKKIVSAILCAALAAGTMLTTASAAQYAYPGGLPLNLQGGARAARAISSDGESWAYTYGADGRIASAVYKDKYGSENHAFSYDTAGRVVKDTVTSAGSPTVECVYTYDARGSVRTEASYFDLNGTRMPWSDGASYVYTYDTAGRIATERNNFSGTVISYTYDARGNVLTAVSGGETVTYTYSYDATGNVLSKRAAYPYATVAYQYTYTYPAGVSAPVPQVSLSNQNLTVDGKAVRCEKYNVDGYNYFKLRDLAYLLNGTGSRFSVEWDAAANLVRVTSGAAYTPDGSELKPGADKSATAVPSTQSIVINGKKIAITAYNIGGNNYFKLRDLGSALGFSVGYDEGTRTATVTSAGN